MLTGDIALSTTGDLLMQDGDISLVYNDELVVQMFVLNFRGKNGDWRLFPEIGMDLVDFTRQPNTSGLGDSISRRIYSVLDGQPIFRDYRTIVDIYPTDVNDLKIETTIFNPDGKELRLPFSFDLVRGGTTGLDEYNPTSHNIYDPDLIRRVEKVTVRESTDELTIKYKPYQDIDGSYSITIYSADDYDPNDTQQYETEEIEIPVDLETAKEIDLTSTEIYTLIRPNYNIRFLSINGASVDLADLEDADWVHTADDDLISRILIDDAVLVEVTYDLSTTNATLNTTTYKEINFLAMAPDQEDAYLYGIIASDTLAPGAYYIVYDSYRTKE
jgi:hypothetical protein